MCVTQTLRGEEEEEEEEEEGLRLDTNNTPIASNMRTLHDRDLACFPQDSPAGVEMLQIHETASWIFSLISAQRLPRAVFYITPRQMLDYTVIFLL